MGFEGLINSSSENSGSGGARIVSDNLPQNNYFLPIGSIFDPSVLHSSHISTSMQKSPALFSSAVWFISYFLSHCIYFCFENFLFLYFSPIFYGYS